MILQTTEHFHPPSLVEEDEKATVALLILLPMITEITEALHSRASEVALPITVMYDWEAVRPLPTRHFPWREEDMRQQVSRRRRPCMEEPKEDFNFTSQLSRNRPHSLCAFIEYPATPLRSLEVVLTIFFRKFVREFN
jgi:hypothetical protein